MRCVEKRTVAVSRVVPKNNAERLRRLKLYGKTAFMMPEGTPARPNVPAYPVVDRDGCFSCSLAKAAYSRLSQHIVKREYPSSYRRTLKSRRMQLVKRALRLATPGDKDNACNFAIKAAGRVGVSRTQ